MSVTPRFEPACEAKSHYLWEDPPDEDKFSACVHCGMCLESCPTYLETGLEQHSPRGRVHLIKSVARGKMEIGEGFREPIDSCLDCRACETACPSGVQVGTLIEQARGQIFQALPQTGSKAVIQRFFLRGVFPYPKRLYAIGRLLRLYQKSGMRTLVRKAGLLKVLPKHLQEMELVLPEVQEPVRKKYPEIIPAEGKRKKRVALFVGCVMDVVFGGINEATLSVLTRNGCEVAVPRGQRCCGALHVHAGDREQGKRLARQNIDAFLAARVEKVVVNAAGCGCALKEYPELLRHDPAYREKAEEFAAKVEDVCRFLMEHGYEIPKGSLPVRVTYHDACHLAHGQGIREEPRQILKSIRGVELVEMAQSDRCCGSAGIYNLTNPVMASRVLEEKMAFVPPNVEMIAMGNPGCMLQMAAGVKKHGRSETVVHTVQLLHRAYQLGERPNEADGAMAGTHEKIGKEG